MTGFFADIIKVLSGHKIIKKSNGQLEKVDECIKELTLYIDPENKWFSRSSCDELEKEKEQ